MVIVPAPNTEASRILSARFRSSGACVGRAGYPLTAGDSTGFSVAVIGPIGILLGTRGFGGGGLSHHPQNLTPYPEDCMSPGIDAADWIRNVLWE